MVRTPPLLLLLLALAATRAAAPALSPRAPRAPSAARAVPRPTEPARGELDALAEGRACTRCFYAGDVDALWPRFSEALRQVFGEPAKLREFRAALAEQLGDEREVLREDVLPREPWTVYRRKARFAKHEEPILVTWSFDAEGVVGGFQVAPETQRPAPSQYLEHETRTALRLPFAPGDEWYVFWGGRELEQNYHAAYLDQRFAYDFVALEGDSTRAGEGDRNEDYHCFDRAIVAPGAGVVVAAANDVADNVPGEMNPRQPLGNHVVIDHGNGEYSFLAHFREGSVVVEPGQEVAVGDALGRCGNSGNSSEPHLHYHLQDAPEFQQGGRGMPSRFLDYVADGERIERGEPVRGQRVGVPDPAGSER